MLIPNAVSIPGRSNNGNIDETTQTFKGLVVASVTATTIGRTLHHELSPQFANTVALMDRKGVPTKMNPL